MEECDAYLKTHGTRLEVFPAEAADMPGIIEIQHAAFAEESSRYGNIPMAPLSETAEEAWESVKRGDAVILKAQIGEELAGAVRFSVDGRVCKIGRLCVDARFRRRGAATALLAACEALAPEVCTYFEIFTGHRSFDNRRLYESLGYKYAFSKKIDVALTFDFLRKRRDETGAGIGGPPNKKG